MHEWETKMVLKHYLEQGVSKAEPGRAMRDAHLREIRRLGRYEWRISSGCTRQSLAENAMSRFKTLFGPKLSARRFDNQRVEAIIKCEVLNRMSSRGMPESVRIR